MLMKEKQHMEHLCVFQVLTSLDEAQIAAGIKEGKAWARFNVKGKTPSELPLRKVC